MMKVKAAMLSDNKIYYINGKLYMCSRVNDFSLYDFSLWPLDEPKNSFDQTNILWLHRGMSPVRRNTLGHIVINDLKYHVCDNRRTFKYFLNKQDIKLVISL